MFDLNMVKERLTTFGYELKEGDEAGLTFCIEKVLSTIRNETNRSDIPEGLECHAADMVCGDFLNVKYRVGKLSLTDLDLNGALASVNVGGTSVSFDNSSTDESKFNTFIQMLHNSGRGEFACYRKIRW